MIIDKPQFFVLTVTIPIEDNFEIVLRLLRFTSYEKEYLPSNTGVHKMVYRFGPLTLQGVENFKMAFREIFDKSPFANTCQFLVAEIPQ